MHALHAVISRWLKSFHSDKLFLKKEKLWCNKVFSPGKIPQK